MDIYSKKLISEGVVTKEEFNATVDKYERICEDAYKKAGEETQVRKTLKQIFNTVESILSYLRQILSI